MYRADHRGADAEHQGDTDDKHCRRNADIDSGETVAADTLTDEDAVDGSHRAQRQHTHQRREEIQAEKFRDFETTQVNLVTLHKELIYED